MRTKVISQNWQKNLVKVIWKKANGTKAVRIKVDIAKVIGINVTQTKVIAPSTAFLFRQKKSKKSTFVIR